MHIGKIGGYKYPKLFVSCNCDNPSPVCKMGETTHSGSSNVMGILLELWIYYFAFVDHNRFYKFWDLTRSESGLVPKIKVLYRKCFGLLGISGAGLCHDEYISIKRYSKSSWLSASQTVTTRAAESGVEAGVESLTAEMLIGAGDWSISW